METIHLICGKICSGKSFYARTLKAQIGGVILSTDEVTFDLMDNQQGEGYDAFAKRVNLYLRKKAGEIASAGCPVILDWGFWSRQDRQEITEYYQQRSIPVKWYYIDVPDDLWARNIHVRNKRISAGLGGWDFYVDEGLLKKVVSLFEVPDRSEMDLWHIPTEE